VKISVFLYVVYKKLLCSDIHNTNLEMLCIIPVVDNFNVKPILFLLYKNEITLLCDSFKTMPEFNFFNIKCFLLTYSFFADCMFICMYYFRYLFVDHIHTGCS
jgi:hypothetical protein